MKEIALLLLLVTSSPALALETENRLLCSSYPVGMPVLVEIDFINTTKEAVYYDLGREKIGKLIVRLAGKEYPLRAELPTGGLILEGSTTLRASQRQKVVFSLHDWLELPRGHYDMEILLREQPSIKPIKLSFDVVEATKDNLEIYLKALLERAQAEVHVDWRRLFMAAAGEILEGGAEGSSILADHLKSSPGLQREIARSLKMERNRMRAID